MQADQFVAKTQALAPVITAHADQAERERRLPAPVAAAFAREGLYRVAAPRACHGHEADPLTQMRVIEAASRIDGSAGWNLMIGIETFGLVAPGLATCPELIEDPLVVMASSTAAVGRAERMAGGWRVRGQWQFVSGIHNASIFGATVRLFDGDEPVDAVNRYAVVPAEDYEIVDTWHVSGLRGSGSHDVRIEDALVPDERIIVTLGGAVGDGPLGRIPLGTRLAYNKVAVALGIARAGIDAFMDLASAKTGRFSDRKVRERPFAQRALAMAEARLLGVRASVFELLASHWAKIVAGEKLTARDRALFQIVCSDAVLGAADAVDAIAEAAGTTANQIGHPLERICRDVRVVRQHFTVAPHHIEDGGRVLLGLPAQGLMLAGLGN